MLSQNNKIFSLEKQLSRAKEENDILSRLADGLKEEKALVVDSKNSMDMAYNGLLVEHKKLEKARNDDLSIIEQLWGTVEKDVDIIAALKKENAELAKASSEKDLKILNTEEELARVVKGIAEETKAWRSNFELLFEKHEDALSTFGVRPNPFPATGGPQEMMD